MNSPLLQLLVLAGIAVFLILRLRSVLGTRDGFEKPPAPQGPSPVASVEHEDRHSSESDYDIEDHVDAGSGAAAAFARMKDIEPSFNVGDFLQGARGAYEMILMSFERGEMDDTKQFLGDDVAETFDEAISARREQGLTIEAEFIGVRELAVEDATFAEASGEAEITVRFIGELTQVVRNSNGDIVEGSATQIKKQKDVWTFARRMGSNDPNWKLIATDG